MHLFWLILWFLVDVNYWIFLSLFLQDYVNSNNSVKREPASVGKKESGKSTKKTGILSLQFYAQPEFLWLMDTNKIVFINPDKGKTAKEEAREILLKEEASTRQKVMVMQKNLCLMLRALGEMAIANPVFTHSQLPSLVCIYVLLRSFSDSSNVLCPKHTWIVQLFWVICFGFPTPLISRIFSRCVMRIWGGIVVCDP